MRILITGAAGFIGSHLAERLAADGHDVVGIDNFNAYYAPALKRINAEDIRAAGVTLHEFDLVDDALSPALEGVEAVYHCAAQPGISDTTPFENYLRNNILATRRLAEACFDVPTLRLFVNVATSSVYGQHATDSEETPPKPTSYYGVTKLAAEQLVLAYQRERGFPACSLRLFSVYGPRERPEKLFPKLMHAILAGTPFPLYEGSRAHSRSFTFVDDIVQGFVAVLGHIDAVQGEIFNIGSDIEITTGRGIEIVEEILGQPAAFEMRPKRQGDQLRTHANIDKARRVLGYEPQTPPEEGLRAAADWCQSKVFGQVQVYG